MAAPEERSGDSPEPVDREQYAGMPRWVKALGLVVLLAVLVLLGVHLAGGGVRHGPSHSGSPAVISTVGHSQVDPVSS
ncbi:hypothetical protein [Kribbella swartbergensis]